MALEGLGAQMGDTVTLEVLSSGEGFPTTLLCTDKATVIIVFPDKHREGDYGQWTLSQTHTSLEVQQVDKQKDYIRQHYSGKVKFIKTKTLTGIYTTNMPCPKPKRTAST